MIISGGEMPGGEKTPHGGLAGEEMAREHMTVEGAVCDVTMPGAKAERATHRRRGRETELSGTGPNVAMVVQEQAEEMAGGAVKAAGVVGPRGIVPPADFVARGLAPVVGAPTPS